MHVNQSRIDEVKSLFNRLNAKNTEILAPFYADNVVFEDPMTRVEGLENLQIHFQKAYKHVKQIKFDFVDQVAVDHTVVLFWTMHLITPRLNKGKELQLEGCSKLVFDEKGLVCLHKEYFDLGDFIYERLPLIGNIIRTIKKAL